MHHLPQHMPLHAKHINAVGGSSHRYKSCDHCCSRCLIPAAPQQDSTPQQHIPSICIHPTLHVVTTFEGQLPLPWQGKGAWKLAPSTTSVPVVANQRMHRRYVDNASLHLQGITTPIRGLPLKPQTQSQGTTSWQVHNCTPAIDLNPSRLRQPRSTSPRTSSCLGVPQWGKLREWAHGPQEQRGPASLLVVNASAT